MNGKRILAIIPARGGSKGVKNKNIAPLGGKPLIGYTIEAAKQSKCLERVIVSTDSAAIADIARSLGAEVPFLRPPELARDDTPGTEPILHAVRWVQEHEDYHPDFIACLQPTSPFRTAADIEAAVSLIQNGADGVIAVSQADCHPYWMKELNGDGTLRSFLESERGCHRRQDLPDIYVINGSIYIAKSDTFLTTKSFYSGRTRAYIMPGERSMDIDTEWDLYIADLVMRDARFKA